MTSIKYVLIVLFAALFLIPQFSLAKVKDVYTIDRLRMQRREAAFRQRRVIYNNDGYEAAVRRTEITPENFLKNRTMGIENTHVDTISYCTGLTLSATHRTDIAERFSITHSSTGTYNTLGSGKWNFVKVLDKDFDVCPLELIVNYGREHNIEIWWSLRMNDRHDSRSAANLTQWKKDHPEYLLGTPEDNMDTYPFGVNSWSALNYAKPAVRDRIYKIVEEVCLNFDVDGIELDFFRHPLFFKEVVKGEKASEQNLSKMTDLIRRIRHMTEVVGLERGKPLLVITRVPDSLEYSKGIGLDVESWLQEGLVDVLVGGGYFTFKSWQSFVEIGKQYCVPVYACITARRIAARDQLQDRDFMVRRWRGEALSAWKAGVNGIYTFNLWYGHVDALPWGELAPEYIQLFSQIGDPELLMTLPREGAPLPGYQETCWSKPQSWLVDGDRYVVK